MYSYEEELKELKEKICQFEKKYSLLHDYDIITSLLNKLDVKVIELDMDEISNNNIYVVTKDYEKRKIIIERGNNK